MKNESYREKLIAEIEKQAQSIGVNMVFTTFLELSATSIAAQLSSLNGKTFDEQYKKLTAKMTPNDLDAYARMLAMLYLDIREHMNAPCDILGNLYHKLGLHSKKSGQFFTPNNVCRMMGGMLNSTGYAEKYPIMVDEPSCGSGAMIIGTVQALMNESIDFRHKYFFTARDIDLRCVWMTYIQLSMYEIPAVVIHGDTLTGKEWTRMYTLNAKLPFNASSTL